MTDDWGFETAAIHAGQEPDPATGAVDRPDLPDLDLRPGRRGRPAGRLGVLALRATRRGPRSRRASPTLEHGTTGSAFASGLAADRHAAARASCAPGDHVVIPHDAYGGTFRLVARVLERWGLAWTRARPHRPRRAGRRARRDADARGVVRDADQPAARHRRHRRGGRASPTRRARCSSSTTRSRRRTCSSPLDLGADVVVHSTTKYLGGHSDVVGGAIVVADHDARRRAALPPERDGRDRRAVRRLAGAPVAEDARACGWSATATTPRRVVDLLVGPPGGRRGPLPGPPRVARPRRRGAADAPARRHGELPRRWRGRRGRRHLRGDAAVHPGRVARWRGVAHRAPGGR